MPHAAKTQLSKANKEVSETKQQFVQLEQTLRALEQENGTYKQMLDAAKTRLSKANKEVLKQRNN